MSVSCSWGRSVRCLLVGLFVLSGTVAHSQYDWYRDHFMSEDGLLQNRVHAMLQDQWGALVIGTEGGLVRYDGHHFKQIGISAPDGMHPSRVLDMVVTYDGDFVIRDAGCRHFLLRAGEFSGITMEAPARPYLSRFAGSMCSASVAVRAMDPDSVLPGKEEWPAIVRSVVLDAEHWCLRTDSMLLVYSNDKLVDRFPLPYGRSAHLFTIAGQLYTMDRNGQALRIDVEKRSYTKVALEGLPDTSQGLRLFWDPQHKIATLLVAGKLYVLEPTERGTLRTVQLDLELPRDAKVGPLVWLDGTSAFAMGTDTKGMFIYRRNSMVSLLCGTGSEDVNNAYNAQAPIGRSGILTSNRAGARLFTAEGCDQKMAPIRRFNDAAIVLDKDQLYWYGRGDTLFTYDPVLGEERFIRSGMRPLSFLEEEGRLLVGTGSGLFSIVNGRIELVQRISEADLSLRPLSLCRTPEGELWAATCSGVFRIPEGGGWEAVPGLDQVCARELAVIDGAVFVGTYGSGAFLVRDGGIHKLPMDEQGFLSHVHAFMPDGSGFLWMSSNQGLFRVRLKDLWAWSESPRQKVFYAYYGKQAGIVNAEFNGGCSPAYVRTTDGWASFPTMDGLVWFRPEEIADAYPLSNFLLEGVQVDGEAHDPAEPLNWNHQEVVVKLSLAYWGSPDNVRLEYTLEKGDDVRWLQMPSGQRELRLGSIAAGKRTLRVRKVGAVHRGDPDILELDFDVPAPYYQRAWFILAMVAVSVLLLIAVLRINAMRLRRRNLQLERMVSERTGELMKTNEVLRRSLEMKELLVSIISHDIVTPLRFLARVTEGSVRRLTGSVDPILAGTLADVSRSSSKLFDNAQNLLQWIKRQDGRIELRVRRCNIHLLVEEVLDRERERAMERQVELINAVPGEQVLSTDRNVLSIILHNALANAITHTAQGSVRVVAEFKEGAYWLSITDTGEGIPQAVMEHAVRLQNKGGLGAMNPDGERDVQGLGLLIIADLLELLGGRFEINSSPGVGTTITFIVPVLRSDLEKE